MGCKGKKGKRGRYLVAAALATIVMAGCKPAPATPPGKASEAEKAVNVCPAAAECAIGVAAMKSPANQARAVKAVAKLSTRDVRIVRYARLSRVTGIVLVVLGALGLLGWLAQKLGWSIPWVSPALTFLRNWMGSKWSAVVRHVVAYLLVTGGLLIAASFWMEPLFTAAYWTAVGIGALGAAVVVWEAACLYYTGKLDAPGDGKKPGQRK